MTEAKDQCVQPAKGPIMNTHDGSPEAGEESEVRGGMKNMVRIGKPAPDFEASAFVDGGFKNIKLSDYLGKWVVLCFYPGDFTFV